MSGCALVGIPLAAWLIAWLLRTEAGFDVGVNRLTRTDAAAEDPVEARLAGLILDAGPFAGVA